MMDESVVVVIRQWIGAMALAYDDGGRSWGHGAMALAYDGVLCRSVSWRNLPFCCVACCVVLCCAVACVGMLWLVCAIPWHTVS